MNMGREREEVPGIGSGNEMPYQGHQNVCSFKNGQMPSVGEDVKKKKQQKNHLTGGWWGHKTVKPFWNMVW
jgi:hypothetical protein